MNFSRIPFQSLILGAGSGWAQRLGKDMPILEKQRQAVGRYGK